MWQRKKSQYCQVTSASVSFFQIKKIYCVTFIATNRWFNDLDEAERYKATLYEDFFFDFESACSIDNITIKEYYIPKPWCI